MTAQQTIGQSLVPEFDQEMAGTRKVLERLPDDKLDWKAHEKSNSIGWVANHLADLPSWVAVTFNQDSLDLDPPDRPKQARPPAIKSRQECLDRFDKNVTDSRHILASVSDGEFAKPWSLLNHGVTVFTMPKGAVLRNVVLNHIIHHRAILCVYYRLNNIPVPALYGPSADES